MKVAKALCKHCVEILDLAADRLNVGGYMGVRRASGDRSGAPTTPG